MRLIIQAGTLLLVARILGAQQFGAFAAVAATGVMFGSLSTFGMRLILLRDVSRNGPPGLKTLRVALPLTLLCGTALLLLFLSTSLLLWGKNILSIGATVSIGIAETIFTPLLTLRSAGQHGLGRIALSQLTIVAPLALRLVVAIGIFATGPADPLSMYAHGYLLAVAAVLGVSLRTQVPRWPGFRTWRLPGYSTLRRAAGYSVLNFNRIGPAELDKALAGALLPAGNAGTYSAASRIISAATLPVTAMNLSALPRMFQESETQPRPSKLLRTMYAAALGYGVVVAAGVWLIAPVFPWILGADYGDLEGMIRLLCVAIPGMTLRLVGGNALMVLDKPWIRTAVEGVGMGALTLAAIFLSARLGGTGIVIALMLSEWGMALVSAAIVRHQLGRLFKPGINWGDQSSNPSGHDHQLAAKPSGTKPTT